MKFGTRIAVATFVVVATHIGAAILIWIVPRFKKLADDFGEDLWAPARMLIAVSDAVARYWYIYLPTIFAASVLFVVLPLLWNPRSWGRSDPFPDWNDPEWE